MEVVSPPRLLTGDDLLDAFDCGIPALNDWLKRRALANHVGGASRSYVVSTGKVVVGYYCILAGGIIAANAPNSIRRNMPDPIPIILLGRLAVDLSVKGRGIGAGLLLHAIEQTQEAAKIAGVRAMMVHAKDTAGAAFYHHFGFVASTLDELTLMLRL